MIVIGDNRLAVRGLVGSELAKQGDALREGVKQGLALLPVELRDVRSGFLGRQSGFFEPFHGRRKPGPAGDRGSDIKLVPFRMPRLQVIDMGKKGFNEPSYPLIAARTGWPIIGHQNGSHRGGFDRSIV